MYTYLLYLHNNKKKSIRVIRNVYFSLSSNEKPKSTGFNIISKLYFFMNKKKKKIHSCENTHYKELVFYKYIQNCLSFVY